MLSKVMAMGASLAPLAATFLSNDLSAPVLGVQLTTVAGAILGTYAAIAYDTRMVPRGRLLALAPSTVILASAAVGTVPHAFGWTWSSGGTESALAVLAALVIYYALPPAIKRVGELIAEFKLTDYLPAKWRRDSAWQDPGYPDGQGADYPPVPPPVDLPPDGDPEK